MCFAADSYQPFNSIVGGVVDSFRVMRLLCLQSARHGLRVCDHGGRGHRSGTKCTNKGTRSRNTHYTLHKATNRLFVIEQLYYLQGPAIRMFSQQLFKSDFVLEKSTSRAEAAVRSAGLRG